MSRHRKWCPVLIASRLSYRSRLSRWFANHAYHYYEYVPCDHEHATSGVDVCKLCGRVVGGWEQRP